VCVCVCVCERERENTSYPLWWLSISRYFCAKIGWDEIHFSLY
jgi:hypothetical protein